MPQAQSAACLLADSLCCLGLGLLAACLYDLARSFLGRAKLTLFFLDTAAFALAAVLAFGYGAARSHAGGVRWYMLAALFAGAVAYSKTVAPVTRAAEKRTKWLLSRPFALLAWVLWPLAGRAEAAGKKIYRKSLEKRQEKRLNRLQKKARMLYNSN
ncbi:MAG: hypothetical protein IIV90_05500 [Oscillospiraceae bacterium]|nr:hypothetical protein [Oscillospiraceae bacterium]